jgi:hypothetical protein
MAAKKTRAAKVDMARVTVLISFNGLYKGDVVITEYDDKVCAWESLGLVRAEFEDGKDPARPSSSEPADSGSVPERAERSGSGRGEQGEDPVPG